MIFAAVYYETMPQVIKDVIPGVSGDVVSVGDHVEIANLRDGQAYKCTIIARNDDTRVGLTFDVRINLEEEPEQIVL